MNVEWQENLLMKRARRKLHFCLNEHFFVSFQVQYRSSGAKFNMCTSSPQDELVWYYCYRWPPRMEKRNLLYAMPKIKANFSVNLSLVTSYMILYPLSELATRNQIITIWSLFCKWNDRHRLGQITSCLYTETITVFDTLDRKKTVWILHFKLVCPEISEHKHYWGVKKKKSSTFHCIHNYYTITPPQL